jgi:hypothetical protein
VPPIQIANDDDRQQIIARGPHNNLESNNIFDFDREEILLGIYDSSLEKVKKKQGAASCYVFQAVLILRWLVALF